MQPVILREGSTLCRALSCGVFLLHNLKMEYFLKFKFVTLFKNATAAILRCEKDHKIFMFGDPKMHKIILKIKVT